MPRKFWFSLILVLAVIGVAGYISLPSTTSFLGRETVLRQGLDLQGGARLVYKIDMSDISADRRFQAVESTRLVIERRVNATGVTEPVIQPGRVGGEFSMIVELPGIEDIDQAIELIGRTAQLQFKELDAAATGDTPVWLPTGLTGKQLTQAQVGFDQTTNAPKIDLEFDQEGATLFADLTGRNIGRPIAIFLDEEMLSAPNVNSRITGGRAEITGDFTVQEVRELVQLLNAGALDAPISLVEHRTIGATLGEESVKKSLIAGAIGLILVAVFMVLNYGLPGAVSVLALIGYTLITFAVIKLIPVTMTLSGLAGFILSIGMAVDANVLIFERMREERRAGRDLRISMEEGFRRAWPSVRDSNMATIITCAILYFTTTGLVRGFALTLAIGVIISLFSSITASRSFLRLASLIPIMRKGLERV